MLRTTLKTGLVATALLAAVVGPATAASAQSATVTDSAGDVWQSIWNPETEEETFVAAGSLTNVDVLSTVVDHTRSSLEVTMTFSDLAKEGARPTPALVMRFNQGPRRVALVDASTSWKGKDILFKDGKNSNGPSKCDGFTHKIDYTTNTVAMSIPRSCLGTPRWIEAAPVTQGVLASTDGGESQYFFDNGGKPGHSYTLPWSTRVRKG
jgi:hypothetical protein